MSMTTPASFAIFARRTWEGLYELTVHLHGNEGVERGAVSSVIEYISGFK
jgi:hypothetical protein